MCSTDMDGGLAISFDPESGEGTAETNKMSPLGDGRGTEGIPALSLPPTSIEPEREAS